MKMQIDQQRAQFTIIALCAVVSGLSLGISLLGGSGYIIGGSVVGLLVFGGLAVVSHYRVRWANLVTVILTTLITIGALVVDAQSRGEFSPALFVPSVLALILAGPTAVAFSGVAVLGALAVLAPAANNPYLQPLTVVISFLVIAGMTVGRLILDGLIQRSAVAEQSAREAQADALREAEVAQHRAEALELQSVQQQRLIEVITTLEMPMVALAENIFLLPLLGHLDSRRLHTLSTRVLTRIGEERVAVMIIDLAGVALIDTQVGQNIHRLIEAIRLMGVKVYLTGIQADVARTMTELGIQMSSFEIARTPQEVLGSVRVVNRLN